MRWLCAMGIFGWCFVSWAAGEEPQVESTGFLPELANPVWSPARTPILLAAIKLGSAEEPAPSPAPDSKPKVSPKPKRPRPAPQPEPEPVRTPKREPKREPKPKPAEPVRRAEAAPQREEPSAGSGLRNLPGRWTPQGASSSRDELVFTVKGDSLTASGDFIVGKAPQLDGRVEGCRLDGGRVFLDGDFIFRDAQSNKVRLKAVRVDFSSDGAARGSGSTIWLRAVSTAGQAYPGSFAFSK